MAYLRHSAVDLTGGCHCRSVRYTIRIPEYAKRPQLPGVPLHTEEIKDQTECRLPMHILDHCQTCRVSCGGILQAWLIIPETWYSVQLTGKDGLNTTLHGSDAIFPSAKNQQTFTLRAFEATEGKVRTFCGKCGTSFTYGRAARKTSGYGQILDVSTGTLDEEFIKWEDLVPERHVWWERGGNVPWIKRAFLDGCRKMIRHPAGDPSAICEDWLDEYQMESNSKKKI